MYTSASVPCCRVVIFRSAGITAKLRLKFTLHDVRVLCLEVDCRLMPCGGKAGFGTSTGEPAAAAAAAAAAASVEGGIRRLLLRSH